jgi:hypothetical protein
MSGVMKINDLERHGSGRDLFTALLQYHVGMKNYKTRQGRQQVSEPRTQLGSPEYVLSRSADHSVMKFGPTALRY